MATTGADRRNRLRRLALGVPEPATGEPAVAASLAPPARSRGRRARGRSLALPFGLLGAPSRSRPPIGRGLTASASGVGARAVAGAVSAPCPPAGSPGRSLHRPTRSWSGPATSPTAGSTPTQPPPTCSTASPAPSSPPATTPTRTAAPSSSATATAPTWGRLLARTQPAPGNHDWDTKDLAGYVGYFGEPRPAEGTSWYSYDLGTWHVIVLDSDCTSVGRLRAGPTQGRWLAADLAASTARCTLAIWHLPRFSSGDHGSDASVAPFWTALYGAGADIVVNGHDNDYERFAPQDPDGRAGRAKGIREFVVGTGGAPLGSSRDRREQRAARPQSPTALSASCSTTASYDWKFIPTTGDVTDAGTGFCH